MRNTLNALFINSNIQYYFNLAQIFMPAGPGASTSVHDLLAFVIPILFTFVQMKYPNENLFETHPVAINIVLYSLLAYSLAFGVRNKFLVPCAPWFHMAMLVFGSVSLASLLSLLFPNYYSSWKSLLCVSGVVLSLMLLAYLGSLLLGSLMRRRARQRRVRTTCPLLPVTVIVASINTQ